MIAADAETPGPDVDFRRKGLLEPWKAEARESAISQITRRRDKCEYESVL